MQTQAQRNAGDAIELGSLKTRLLGNLQLVERVLGKFSAQLDADLATLDGALECHDAGAFCAAAHRLKGMSANVEAWPLHDCAREAEELAQGEDLAELAGVLEKLHEMRQQISTALKARTAPSAEASGIAAAAGRA